MFQKFVRFVTVAGLLVLSAAMSLGQVEQGTVTGTVIDASNAAVVDAKVTLTNVDTQVAAVTTTNQQGHYNFPFTAPGHYQGGDPAPAREEVLGEDGTRRG